MTTDRSTDWHDLTTAEQDAIMALVNELLSEVKEEEEEERHIAAMLLQEGSCGDCGGSVCNAVDARAHASGKACIDKSEREDALRMACAAADQAQLAACIMSQAASLEREARRICSVEVPWTVDPDISPEWSVDTQDGRFNSGLPDDWMAIGQAWLAEKAAEDEMETTND